MDRRSLLWSRNSLENSPGDTESSRSASSLSERYSDDQEVLMASPNNASPNHDQSPEVTSNISGSEVHETVKSMTQKLSAALSNVSAKENSVKQHMKVAEEAISGWEKAETEVATLKQQLEAAAQKNSALEVRIGHLGGALKESVRQLRLSREDQEQKVHDALMKKTREWESVKFVLESRLIEVQLQLEAATSVDHDLRSKLEAAEKENTAFKVELLVQSEELRMRTLEKELSTRAAESASKQHLESIKKMTKLEAECRRLRSVARRTSSANDYKNVVDSVCAESLTDSQSDSGERLHVLHNETSSSDSWASALIAELDQFKNEKVGVRSFAASSIEIDLMDDFLEMERVVEMPDAESSRVLTKDSTLKFELEAVRQSMSELEEKVEKMETEKAGLEMALADTRDKLKLSCNQLVEAEDRLVVLQRHMDFANEATRKTLECQLESAHLEVRKLHEKVVLLEDEVEEERSLSAELAFIVEAAEVARKASEIQVQSAHAEVGKMGDRVRLLEGKVEEEKTSLRMRQESELRRVTSSNGELKIKQEELAGAAGKLAECQKTIASLAQQLKSLTSLEDLMHENEKL